MAGNCNEYKGYLYTQRNARCFDSKENVPSEIQGPGNTLILFNTDIASLKTGVLTRECIERNGFD